MPKKVVIDRSKWLNAYTRYTLGPSQMLDQKGNMCCLGFVCAAENVHPKNMLAKLTPRFVTCSPFALVCGTHLTDLANTAMEYNDDSTLSKSGREKALQQIFAAEGTYELEFVGAYPNEHASSNA